MFSNNPDVNFFLENDTFGDPFKIHEDDTVWWIDDMNRVGPRLFSFDLNEVYNYWGDYPDSLTPEQKVIFDKEFPKLAIS